LAFTGKEVNPCLPIEEKYSYVLNSSLLWFYSRDARHEERWQELLSMRKQQSGKDELKLCKSALRGNKEKKQETANRMKVLAKKNKASLSGPVSMS
jgi:hypothetical protein